MRVRPESSGPVEPPTPAQQDLNRDAALDLVSIVGVSGGPGGFMEAVAAMRPQTALSDAQLPQRRVQDGGGNGIEIRRDDNTRVRIYDSGARMELDAQGRATSMQLPGPGGARISMTYDGNNPNPSSITHHGGKIDNTVRAADGFELRVNPQMGWVSVAGPNDGREYLLAGRETRTDGNGITTSVFYNNADRSNTTMQTDLNGNVHYTNVSRADGSGYTIMDGQLLSTRYAVGTNMTIRTQGDREPVTLNNVESIWPGVDKFTGAPNQTIFTRDGRIFTTTGLDGNSLDNLTATSLVEHRRGNKQR